MKNLLRNFTLVVISFLAFSCEKEENKNLPSTSIAKIIEVTPEFSSLKEALDITGLTSTFEGSGDFTVFVPTNEAFAAILGGLTVEEYHAAYPCSLEKILKYHVLGSRVMSNGLTDGQMATTLLGEDVKITLEANAYYPEIDPDLGAVEEKSIFINESRVFTRDVNCSNGIIHVIDAVLQPKTVIDIASANPDLSTLVTALERTGLTAELKKGCFTIFAPTNAAFDTFFASLGTGIDVNNVDVNVLKNVLLNHTLSSIIKSNDIQTGYVSTLSPINLSANAPKISMYIQKNGSTVTINGGAENSGATVTTADIEANNGVIHLVSNVIAIPTLVNHVIANPDFDSLQAVVTSTGGNYGDQSTVLNALLGLTAAAPATLFAPNNSAFTNILSELSTAGISPTAAELSSVLQYHVILGNVRSSALPGIISGTGIVPTLNSQNITFSLVDGAYKITGTFTPTRPASTIIQSLDIQGSNGVIHTIDKVLLPTL
jgi:uncharacterized surface protein with fasciclin (FAS1) repeats